ncbi:FG-GAP repeat protein [Spirillospora sp. CA-294931]|uniref:FG-GAP and VCBS repeat-containing protein n=1 Tax=Spirillospora sp. CA-294931 TaxID=3240042 RepID=UPI003D92A592
MSIPPRTRLQAARRPAAILLLVVVPGASSPWHPLTSSASITLTPASSTQTAVPTVAAAACRGSSASDYNGDGTADLAAGAPYATVGGAHRAGSVAVRYGGGPATRLTQQGGAERGDGFGAALASGDFDGDRCADLAVGVPEEFAGNRVPGAEGHGAVQIYLGSRQGLRAGPLLNVRALGRAYATDRFGAALAAADLDRDGDAELAVGAPGLKGGGGVAVFGLRGRGLRPGPLMQQGTRWVGQNPAETDGFGTVLTTGDFDGDRRPEIAVGAPNDGPKGEGSVTILDPLAGKADYISQSEPGVGGTPERLDGFGTALATADFDGDRRADLAVGVPGEDGGGKAAVGYTQGAVQILRGPLMRQSGPTWTGRWKPRHYDRFGAALAAGDLTADGRPDLAVGAPGRSAVNVLRGASGGLTGTKALTYVSPFGSVGQFGWSLAIRHRGKRGDLFIGAPGAHTYAGAVTQAATPLDLAARGLTGYSLG